MSLPNIPWSFPQSLCVQGWKGHLSKEWQSHWQGRIAVYPRISTIGRCKHLNSVDDPDRFINGEVVAVQKLETYKNPAMHIASWQSPSYTIAQASLCLAQYMSRDFL